jgi:lipooligosaccharide transport system permease protein
MNKPPSFFRRVFAVWYRHQKCYMKHLVANGLPPFMEPLLFLFALGIGLGKYIASMEGMSFMSFIAPAMMATTSLFTASFETTYGAFVRLEYQKTYHNILSTPVTFRDIYIGELLWCGSKGFLFSLSVLIVISLFGLVQYPLGLLTPFVGFFNAIAFGIIGFFVTGFVRNINNFNLYMTGVLTPVFYFAGTFFPLEQMPPAVQKVAQAIPLTHAVIIMRSLAQNQCDVSLLWHFFLILAIPLPFVFFSYRTLRRRLIL